ncbi:MAG: hypothetical protein ACLFOA_08190 [Desulfohalobiaceae bacterium]
MSHEQENNQANLYKVWEPFFQTGLKALTASADSISMIQNYSTALLKYQNDFFRPLFKAMAFFNTVEGQRILNRDPLQTWREYTELLQYNYQIYHRDRLNSLEAILDYHLPELSKAFASWLNSLNEDVTGQDIFDYISFQAQITKKLTQDYPREILNIASEYGFHFESGSYELVQETERFYLYQVLPNEPGVQVQAGGKPILIVHPYVLGADILAFLPGERKSYVHNFANQGIPTYVRILKHIDSNPAVQNIALEDDILDSQAFCSKIKERHGRALTLNGYCQGGLMTLANLLSGKLDGLVDTHITCVAPIDGSRSQGFSKFLHNLPSSFNDLAYGTKRLDNGNLVADGDLMAWVYKIKSIEEEAPTVAFFRDLAMMRTLNKKGLQISKTAAALNYWLTYQRHDLPLEITKLSFASYNTPISKEGDLPFQAFGRKLNMKSIQEKGIKWQICYGESDSLVERETALAPLDYVDAEVSPFPKGHVAIATSWSNPSSECALHTRFGENNVRGPVRYHLDIQAEQDQESSSQEKSSGRKSSKQKSSMKQKE